MLQRSLFLFVLLSIAACKTTQKTPVTDKPATPPATPHLAEKPVEPQKPKEPKVINYFVTLKTDLGDIKIQLYNNTPLHRDNFLKLAREGYYNGTLFHRVISKFMIQGGDPNSRNAAAGVALGMGGPGYTVPAEFRDENVHIKGALAAARTGDGMNPQKASSGSQFYIVQGDNVNDQFLNSMESRKNFKYTEAQRAAYLQSGGTPHLDRDYTVYGMVVEGFDIIDKIAAVAKGAGDRPVQDIKVISTTVEEKE